MALTLFFAASFHAVYAGKRHEFTAEEKAWWAVQPLQETKVTEGAHPVDFFLERKLKESGLEMAEGATAEEFVRRVYFDLHGLPPSVDEVRLFVNAWGEDEDEAVEHLIEELLKSPRYGERWGQHWLDVVRYSDSDGYRADDFRSTAFRYRDYVIRAFNEDKPYDEFVKEQLAGDEIAPEDPDRVTATGFLRLGVYEWNQRNAEMQREIMINEITNVTGEVFMGIGIGCAQCHDHKFDPILQKDYFALQAFLSSTYWPDDRYHATEEEIAEYQKKRSGWEEVTGPIRAEMKALVEKGEKKIYDFRVKTFPPEVQEMFAKPREEQTAYERQISFLVDRQAAREVRTLATAEKVLKKDSPERLRYEELKMALAAFDEQKPKSLPKAFLSTDTGSEAAVVKMDTEEIAPRFMELFGGGIPKIKKGRKTTGRRSALAEWIVREDNPFTARVMVNRIWQHHFGKGIAASPNDFGMLGENPTHPELLDWLARDFQKGDWKIKRMHRVIMTSRAYRQTSRFEPGNLHGKIDPENELMWRFPPKRLSAEQIRDAMLAVSGELKHRNGGSAQASSSPVRSIYVKKMRNTPDQILQCFDSPAGFASEPARSNTTTPTQSLLLANSEWPLARARAMSARLLGRQTVATRKEVAQAFEEAWGRQAGDEEVDTAMAFLKSQRQMPGGAPKMPEDRSTGGVIAFGGEFKGGEEFLEQEIKGALSFVPGSGHERLEVSGQEWEEDHFSVVAVARLEKIHADAKVNTLVAQWNGDHQKGGWTMGVTSASSGYGARNFIVQLTGSNPGGDMEYEVVASGLTVPLGVPVLMAVSVDPRAEGEGAVTFWLKDLSKDGDKVEKVVIGHNLAGGISRKEERVLVGARKDGHHFWEGKVARLSIVSGGIEEANFESGSEIDLFVKEAGKLPDGTRWVDGQKKERKSTDEAFVDFCHALLSSNEFLYLH